MKETVKQKIAVKNCSPKTYCYCTVCGTEKVIKDKDLSTDWPVCPKCKKTMAVNPWVNC